MWKAIRQVVRSVLGVRPPPPPALTEAGPRAPAEATPLASEAAQSEADVGAFQPSGIAEPLSASVAHPRVAECNSPSGVDTELQAGLTPPPAGPEAAACDPLPPPPEGPEATEFLDHLPSPEAAEPLDHPNGPRISVRTLSPEQRAAIVASVGALRDKGLAWGDIDDRLRLNRGLSRYLFADPTTNRAGRSKFFQDRVAANRAIGLRKAQAAIKLRQAGRSWDEIAAELDWGNQNIASAATRKFCPEEFAALPVIRGTNRAVRARQAAAAAAQPEPEPDAPPPPLRHRVTKDKPQAQPEAGEAAPPERHEGALRAGHVLTWGAISDAPWTGPEPQAVPPPKKRFVNLHDWREGNLQ